MKNFVFKLQSNCNENENSQNKIVNKTKSKKIHQEINVCSNKKCNFDNIQNKNQKFSDNKQIQFIEGNIINRKLKRLEIEGCDVKNILKGIKLTNLIKLNISNQLIDSETCDQLNLKVFKLSSSLKSIDLTNTNSNESNTKKLF